jgi:hypothetical protein
MPALIDIQAAFGGSVLKGADDPDLAALVDGNGLTPAQRLSIHGNTALLTLTDALGATFPVVRALVGEAFFAQTARAFIRQAPPTSPVLSAYGAAFADFLTAYEPARALPYLPDVARLEWARQDALHAAEAAPVAHGTLAAIPSALFPQARAALHPSVRSVVSAWPVDRIWAMNQPDWPEHETVSLDEGGVTLLICRPSESVCMARADPGTLALLLALDRGETLEAAAGAATAASGEAGFDLTGALGLILSLGLLTDVAVPLGADVIDTARVPPLSQPETPPP